MNKVDKFDVDLEFFFVKFILRKKDDKLLNELLFTFNETKPHVIPYILLKFNKKKCACCDGKGYLSG